MKKVPFLLVLILLLFGASSHAEVLIFKGILKFQTVAPPQTLPKVIKIYYLLDPATAQASTIQYFTLSGTKSQVKGAPYALHFTHAPALNGKVMTAFVADNAAEAEFTDADNFKAGSSLFYGINSSLTFKSGLGTVTTNFPRLFTGLVTVINSTSGAGVVILAKTVVSYKTQASIAANDANQTLQEATDAISANLVTKGFNP